MTGAAALPWAGRSRRVPAAALIVLSIAACGGGGTPPSAPGSSVPVEAPAAAPAASQPALPPPGPFTPSAQLRVGFGGVVDTVLVSAVEQLPLREAALIAPDGTVVPARYINAIANPRLSTGQWSLSNRWDDPVTPDNARAVLALPAAQAGAALYSSQQLLAMVSRADIPLPDPVAYRRDWRTWRVRLTFGTPPGEVVTTEVPAPEPPPG